jgi:hypothetical protein
MSLSATARRVRRCAWTFCVLLAASSQQLAAQTTVAVSGHAQIPDGSAPSNTKIRFELIGCSNGQARVDGVALFSDYHKDFDVTAGVISGTLYPNTSIDCNGTIGSTKYNATFLVSNQPKGQTVCYSVGPGSFVLESAQPCVTSPAIVTANAVVTNPQGEQDVTQPDAAHPLNVNFLQVGSCVGCSSAAISQRTITGTVNGANTIFTLPTSPPAGGLLLLENGLMLTSGSGKDFTITGNTITFLLAPAIGTQLLAFY